MPQPRFRDPVVVVVCLVLATAAAGSAEGAVLARAPGPHSLATGSYLGALVNPHRSRPSSTPSEVSDLEARIGRRLGIVNHCYSYPRPVGTQGEVQDIAAGRIPMLTWGATDTSAILSGNHHAYLTQRALRLKNLGSPVFLRYFHEPEGAYRSVIVGSTQDYIASWRRAYDVVGRPARPTSSGSSARRHSAPGSYRVGESGHPGAQGDLVQPAEVDLVQPAEVDGEKTSFPLVQAVIAWSTTNTKNRLVHTWTVDSTSSALAAWRQTGQDSYYRP